MVKKLATGDLYKSEYLQCHVGFTSYWFNVPRSAGELSLQTAKVVEETSSCFVKNEQELTYEDLSI
jgi:hypothetical protein